MTTSSPATAAYEARLELEQSLEFRANAVPNVVTSTLLHRAAAELRKDREQDQASDKISAELNQQLAAAKDAIYSADLGICVLETMCKKARLGLGAQRSKELLVELGTAFPFISERVAQSALRGGKA